MNDKEKTIVYWAPGYYNSDTESWELLYEEPKSLLPEFISKRKAKSEMSVCPSVKNILQNTFVVKSTLEDNILLPNLSEIESADPSKFKEKVLGDSKVAMIHLRPTSFDGYVNVSYNLKWLFFSEDSLQVRLTPPFFPESPLCSGSIFSVGEMDIGKWFRPMNLDYHIPEKTSEIIIKEDQPLAYFQFLTDKKVILQRFNMTPKLLSLSKEMSNASQRYGRGWSLNKRYALANKSSVRKIILSEIKKNLV